MHCGIELLCSYSFTSEVPDHTAHWLCMAYRFVTLLSTSMVNSLEKIVMLAERACHGVVPHNGAMSSTTTQLLWLLYVQAKSVHSEACIVLTRGIFENSKRK